MKTISLFITAAALVFSTAALSFGQTRQAATAEIPSVTYEILEQPDSPLGISADEKMAARVSGAPLKITNNGSSAVSSFVLHIKSGKQATSYMVFIGKGIAPAAFHIQGVNILGTPAGNEQPVVSVDYVQFADGRSWGADTLGKSKHVQAFLDGRALALTRLKDLLAGQDDTDFMKSIDMFRSSSFGEPVFPPGRAPRNIDYSAKGYEEILNILRRMPKRVDEGKELARRLELMQLSGT